MTFEISDTVAFDPASGQVVDFLANGASEVPPSLIERYGAALVIKPFAEVARCLVRFFAEEH